MSQVINEEIYEKLTIVSQGLFKKRLSNEIKEIIEKRGYDVYYINLNIYKNTTSYLLTIYDYIKNIYYEFILNPSYPFTPPKLFINNEAYTSYLRLKSIGFADLLYKYKKIRCFCCETILCPDNWGPSITINKILDEFDKYNNYCKEISYRVIINVIKRKYLIDDINLIQWLY